MVKLNELNSTLIFLQIWFQALFTWLSYAWVDEQVPSNHLGLRVCSSTGSTWYSQSRLSRRSFQLGRETGPIPSIHRIFSRLPVWCHSLLALRRGYPWDDAQHGAPGWHHGDTMSWERWRSGMPWKLSSKILVPWWKHGENMDYDMQKTWLIVK